MTPPQDIHPLSDYECFINVHNKTSVDLILDESGIAFGEWAKGSPPNTIEAGTVSQIRLNDISGGGYGSEGYTIYEIYPPGKEKSTKVRLDFCDPTSFMSENYLHAKSSKPQQVSVNVLDYSRKGHPFTAHVEIYLAGEESKSQLTGPIPPIPIQDSANERLRANFSIGFDSVGGLLHWQPVHEDIAIAAFIKSTLHFPPGLIYSGLDLKKWEYFRGLLWPDDPSCLLFKDSADNNSKFDLGDDFLSDFWGGSPACMTQRSHYGDLQFLHSMATQAGESPKKTQSNMLKWFEVMYKLAVGVEGVHEVDTLHQRLPASFSSQSNPSGQQTLRDLLLGRTTAYRKVEISKRALGVCLHMIQDSYAVGHTLRRLKNINDLESRDDEGEYTPGCDCPALILRPCAWLNRFLTTHEGFVRFKPGTYAQLGPIITFHTYCEQSDRHKHYDDSQQPRNPKHLESFNHIIGARDAIEMCKILINFYDSKTKWADGVRTFLAEEVLRLDGNATPSDALVDERFGLPETSFPINYYEKSGMQDYNDGLDRKLALLEGGLAHTRPSPSRVNNESRQWYRTEWILNPYFRAAILMISLILATVWFLLRVM